MSRPRSRFTLKELNTLVRVAREAGSRLILELDRDGKLRVILNEQDGQVEADHEIVM